MYSKFFEERYGDVIRENEVLNEKLQNANKQHLKNQEIIRKAAEQSKKNQEIIRKAAEQSKKNQEIIRKAAEQSKKDQKEIIALKNTLKQYGIPYPIIDS